MSRICLKHAVIITDLRSGAKGLEDLFLELTSTAQRDAAAAPDSLADLSTTNGSRR
ncbi:hypothetical protein [Nocardioides mesophilus]|uniref:Uncharacterized protein n=1 Tax=Nocardioides mesophilus TaxID=433659 RepID=A0A7G9RC96_9ACTN|nr:hypothetical protein [Nocardioides mesophilus]QNN53221.1 hypothetical protein H9L09_01660 [Nocardioides mesophilus]